MNKRKGIKLTKEEKNLINAKDLERNVKKEILKYNQTKGEYSKELNQKN